MATLKDFLKRLAVPSNTDQEYEGEETEPLFTDNTNVSQPTPFQKPIIDGKLTSRMLITSLIPVTLIVVVVFSFLSIADHEKNAVSRSIVNSFCGISSLFMISLFCLSKKFGKKITKPGHDDYLSHAPKIVFTWLFGVSLLFDSGLRIIENVDNIVDNKKNIHGHFPVTFLRIDIVNFLGVCLQLIFVTSFSKCVFRSTLLLNFAMSFMVSQHFLQWFYGMLCSFYRNGVLSPQTRMENITIPNISGVTKLRENLQSVLNPIKTEYNLLVVGFLLSMWDNEMQTRKNNVHQRLSIQQESNEIDSSTEHNTNHSYHFSKSLPCACNTRYNETTRLLVSSYPGGIHCNGNAGDIRSRTDDISRAYGSIERIPMTLHSTISRNRRAGYFYLFLSIGIFLMIPFITTSLILVTVDSQSKRLKFIYEILRNIYIFLSLILVCITLVKINRISIEIPESLRFREKQYIMTISTSGAIAFATLCLLAGALHTPKENYQYMTASTIVVGQAVEIVVIFLQTILIIHSEHVVLRRSSLIIQNCLVLLAMINFTFWATDSFVIASADDPVPNSWIPTEYYGESTWAFVMETIFPFDIFYRFHSFIELYERIRHFKKPDWKIKSDFVIFSMYLNNIKCYSIVIIQLAVFFFPFYLSSIVSAFLKITIVRLASWF